MPVPMASPACDSTCGRCTLYTDLSEGLPARPEAAGTAAAKLVAQAIVVLSLLMVAIYVLQVGHDLAKSLRSGRLRSWCKSRCSSLGTWWRQLMGGDASGQSAKDLLTEQRVQQLAVEEQLKAIHACLQLARPFFALFTLMDMVKLLMAQPLLSKAPSDRIVAMILYEGHISHNFWGLLLVSILCTFPKLVTPRTFKFAVVLFDALLLRCLIWCIAIDTPPTFFWRYHVSEVVFRFVVLPWCDSLRFVVFVNSASSLCTGWLKAYAMSECMSSIVLAEAMYFGLICFTAISFRKAYLGRCRGDLELQRSEHYEFAAVSLMSAMCDAVVHLNGKLEVQKATDLLSALLFKDSVTDIIGQSFPELLKAETDRESLQQLVSHGGGADSAVAGTVHVDLRDLWGAAVPVQLFHTRCLCAFGPPFHIIGIRETGHGQAMEFPSELESSFSDIRPLRTTSTGRRAGGPPENQAPYKVPSWRAFPRPPTPSSDVSSSGSISLPSSSQMGLGGAVLSTREQLPMCTLDHLEDHKVCVWVDVMKSGWPMQKATTEFTLLGGHLAFFLQAPLLAWLGSAATRKFRRWVQDEINTMLENHEQVSSSTFVIKDVASSMPDTVLRACISLFMEEDHEPKSDTSFDWDPDTLLVGFVFRDVFVHRRQAPLAKRLGEKVRQRRHPPPEDGSGGGAAAGAGLRPALSL